MNQLKDEVLCKYCLGCNRLEDPNFAGWRRCKDLLQVIQIGNENITNH